MGDVVRLNEYIQTQGLHNEFLELAQNIDMTSKKFISLINETKQVNQSLQNQKVSQSNASKAIKQTNTNLTKLTTLEKERVKITNQVNQTLSRSIVTGENQNKTLQKGKVAIQQRNQVLRNQAKIERLNTVEGQKLNQTLIAQRKELTRLGGRGKGLTQSLRGMAMGFLGVTAAIYGAFRLIKSSLKTISGFSKGMDEVAAITGATGTEFKELRNDALRLGSTTSKTALQVAGLQKEFAKLGFTSGEIIDATEATISLSIAAGSDLAESAVVAASTVRGFGLTAKDTKKVTDVMAKSFSSSALDLEKFKIAMATVAPVAKNAGVSIEETTANLSVLTDAGLEASTAGTSLRNIYLELSKQGLTWDEALNKIKNSTDKNATALKLFGKRSATAASLLAENREKADRLTKSYENSAGAAKKMADIMEDNLEGDLKKLSSAWEGLVLTFDKSEIGLRKVVQGLVGMLNYVTGIKKEKLSEEIQAQQLEFNLLAQRLFDVNTKEEDRYEIINKLNEINPEFLKGLDTENLELGELQKRLKLANEEYINRIILQQKQEEIESKANAAARQTNRQLNTRRDLQKEITKIGIDLGIADQLVNKEMDEQIKLLKEADKSTRKLGLTEHEQQLYQLTLRYQEYNAQGVQSQRTSEKVNELTQERIDLANELGISLENESDASSNATGIIIDNEEKIDSAKEEKDKEIIDRVSKAFEERIRIQKEKLLAGEITEQQFADRVLAIHMALQRKLIDTTNLSEEEKLKAKDTFLDLQIQSEKETQEALKALMDEGDDIINESIKETNDERKELAKQATDEQIKEYDRQREAHEEMTKAIEEGERQLQETKIAIANAGFDFALTLYDRELNELEAQKEYELSLVGDNEAAKAGIEKKYARQAADIKRKQAIAEKAKGIFNAAINTAQAITAALTIPIVGIALAALVGVLGAIQIAIIAAKPIPKFAKGTKGLKGNMFAEIGEEGPEIINMPDRPPFLVKKRTTAFLPEATEIIPNYETDKILADQGGISEQQFDKLIKATEKKPLIVNNSTLVTEKGFEYQTQKGNTHIKWLNKYLGR